MKQQDIREPGINARGSDRSAPHPEVASGGCLPVFLISGIFLSPQYGLGAARAPEQLAGELLLLCRAHRRAEDHQELW